MDVSRWFDSFTDIEPDMVQAVRVCADSIENNKTQNVTNGTIFLRKK